MPSSSKPVTSSLDSEQTLRAAKALLAHVKSSTSAPSLLTEDGNPDVPVYLNLSTKKFIVDKKKLKPSRIALAHSLYPDGVTSVCLLVKDPQRTYKDLVEEAGLGDLVQRVIGVGKLKAKWKTYEKRRQLRDTHDLFLADDRVVPLLPALLGKVFIEKKRNPVPISLSGAETAEQLKKEIRRATNATYVHLAPGTVTSIKVGTTGMPAEHVAANIEKVVAALVEKYVSGGWKGVRRFDIKTAESASLPIWMTEALYDEEDVVEPAALAKEEKVEEKAKGKKRAAEDDEEAEKPAVAAKKTKSSPAKAAKSAVAGKKRPLEAAAAAEKVKKTSEGEKKELPKKIKAAKKVKA
ncbi:proteasome-interacting protein cic1 [Saitoella coloradoensis]